MLTHASLRTQESNFGSKFQDYFANVRPQESNVHGGEFTGTYMYVESVMGSKHSYVNLRPQEISRLTAYVEGLFVEHYIKCLSGNLRHQEISACKASFIRLRL